VWAARCSTRIPAPPTWARPPSRTHWRGSTTCRTTTRRSHRRCGRTSPPALRPYLAGKTWSRAFGGFDEIRLDLHGDAHRVSLLRLQPGEGLPPHRHVAGEFTVVLQGGYTDNTGNYRVG